ADVAKGGAIRDHPPEAGQLAATEDAEVDRVLERPAHDLDRDPLRPVGARQIGVDGLHVQAVGVGDDGGAVALPLERHSPSVLHSARGSPRASLTRTSPTSTSRLHALRAAVTTSQITAIRNSSDKSSLPRSSSTPASTTAA